MTRKIVHQGVEDIEPHGDVGHLARRTWCPSAASVPDPQADFDRAQPSFKAMEPLARPTWASTPGHEDGTRCRIDKVVHRLVHERAHRGYPRRRRRSPLRASTGGGPRRTRWSCPAPASSRSRRRRKGLDKILVEAAGFDWREPGCSMCLAMNPDKLLPQRALRVHLQPQLRGAPGQLAVARTSSRPPWRRRRPSPARSRTCVRLGSRMTSPARRTPRATSTPATSSRPCPRRARAPTQAGAGGMPKFTVLKGKAAALDAGQNIDTDMIIPAKQFLKTIKRTGLGCLGRFTRPCATTRTAVGARRLRAEQTERYREGEDPGGGR